MQFTPDPPIPGNPFTIKLSGNLMKPISGGSIKATIFVGGFGIWSNVYDICHLTDTNNNGSCPLSIGSFNFIKSVIVPTIIPFVSLSI
ncbi:unnamed protein product [Cunninghamella blakesleeana]